MPESEDIEFVGAGGARLAGRIQLPAGTAVGSVLMAHCFTCSKDLHTLTRLSRRLVDAGYAVARFDFTGLGDSAGDFATTSVTVNVGDLTRAAVTLIERGLGPCVLFGHSLGGAASLLAAARLKTVSEVVVLGAPSDVGHVRALFAEAVDDIEATGRAPVSIGGRSFEIGAEFVADLEQHDVLDAARGLGRPLLVLVPGADTVVAPEHGRAIHEAAREPKSLVVIDGADHLLSDPAHADEAADAMLAFLAVARA
ncbi:MAG: alpha/beta hydrolase [Acidimicrobiia bacterium]|nr:alpha/beta hydrolase [Acidimicrobiia bacterium]